MTDELRLSGAMEEESQRDFAADCAESLPGAIRRFLHNALRNAHDNALETLTAEDSETLAAPKPIRSAVYLSIRRLRLEEDNLRYRTVEALVEGVCASLASPARMEVSERKTLSLMDEEELEDSVLIMSLSAAADAHCAFLRRAFVDALGKKREWEDASGVDSALAPRRFLECYFEHAKPLGLEPELRIALLESFERFVLRRLPALYDLIASRFGVVVQAPGFRQEVGRASRAGSAGAELDSIQQGVVGWTDAVGSEVVSTLLEVLAGRARSSRSSSAPEWPRDRVLACLNRLQTSLARDLSDQALSAGGLAATVEAELRRVFAEDRNAMSRNISDADTAVADLVDMIFDYVIDSQAELHKERKVPLATLRIPYYRVALLDRQLFIKRSHPARRLLERLPGYGLPTEFNVVGRAQTPSLVAVVQRIHREFDGSMEVFDRINAELERDQRSVDSRLKFAERRIVQHAEGRERLVQAWQVAVSLVKTLIDEHSPPRLIRDLLERPWAQYMVLALLKPEKRREGGLDPRDVALELCRVPGLRNGSSALAHAPQHLSRLTKELQHGLVQVGYSKEEVVALWRDIVAVLVTNAHQTSARVQRFESIKAIGHSVDSADRELLRGIAFDATIAARESGATKRDAAGGGASSNADGVSRPATRTACPESRMLEGVALGDWYSESRENAEPLQHKLVWFGKFVNRYLFVDRSGRKTFECAGQEFQELLASNRLVAMEAAPQVELAIRSIFDRVSGAVASKDARAA